MRAQKIKGLYISSTIRINGIIGPPDVRNRELFWMWLYTRGSKI